MRTTLLILAAFLAIPTARAQTWNGPYGSILDDPLTAGQGARALAHLYDMNPAGARLVIDSLKTRYPQHPIGPFLDGLIIWWEILPELSVDDGSNDRAFFDAMDRTIRAADRLPNRFRMDRTFFKAAALGFRGRHLSNREQWLRAARDGKESLDLVFELSEADPANPDFQFGVAVYKYFAEAIPEQYPVVKPVMLFFPNGDREEGLRLLHRVARDGRFVGTEAAYFLLQIYMVFEPDFGQAQRMVELLRERHPANAFFHVLEGRVQARWGRYHTSMEVFEEILALHRQAATGYTDGIAQASLYYLGRSQMATGDLDETVRTFDRLETLAGEDRHSAYRALGRLRAGMALDRLGRRSEAQAAYRLVLRLPEIGDSHDDARRYLRSPFGS